MTDGIGNGSAPPLPEHQSTSAGGHQAMWFPGRRPAAPGYGLEGAATAQRASGDRVHSARHG
jgi:hypothetical protein